MTTRKRVFASEREMHACWSLSAGRLMTTRDGMRVRIVYPGIRAGSWGPDYKDAVVVFGSGAETRGDIELHLDSRDWCYHGHDSDPAYNGVVLHVVGDADGGRRSRLAQGDEVPVTMLGGAVYLPGCSALPCTLQAVGRVDGMQATLACAGLARFRERVDGLAERCTEIEPWKVLAGRIARALGYSYNADAAESVGLRLVAPEVHSRLVAGGDEARRALVMGVAGLLPGQRRRAGIPTADEVPEWDEWWNELEPAIPRVEPSAWRMHGLYPNNSPARRMIALAELWPDMEHLLESATLLVLRERPRECVGFLERSVRRTGPGYWRGHYDFGMRTRESDVIGAGKARELVVNALLPMVAAHAMVSCRSTLMESVLRLYAEYPAAPANAVTRHMRRQLGLASAGGSAAVEQGLLHVFREYCRRGLCGTCPLAAAIHRPVAGVEGASCRQVVAPVLSHVIESA